MYLLKCVQRFLDSLKNMLVFFCLDRMFGFVAKGVEATMGNMCHIFAEYDPLQPCDKVIEGIQAAIKKP